MFLYPLAVIFLTKNCKHFANTFSHNFKECFWHFSNFSGICSVVFILCGKTSNFNFINWLFRREKNFHIKCRTGCFTPSPSQVLHSASARVASCFPRYFLRNDQCQEDWSFCLRIWLCCLCELRTEICGDCVETKGLFSCYHSVLLPSLCFSCCHFYLFEASWGL